MTTLTSRPSQPEIPCLKGPPLFGMLLALRRDRLALFERMARQGGDISVIRAGPRRVVLANTPEFAHQILVEQAESFEKSPALRVISRPLLGNGLLTSDNDFHRRQRKLMAPAFQPRRLDGYAGEMAAQTLRAIDRWHDGVVIDLHAEMMRLTLAVAGKTLFGAEVLEEATELGAALAWVIRHAAHAMDSLFRIPLHWPTPRNRRTREAIARLDATIYRIIRERRESGEDRGDFLSILLQARDEDDGSRMTDTQVRDEAMTLFLASHETTANGLAFAGLLLSRHPEVVEKLQAEADSVLGGRTPTYEDLPRLPYALQVFKESMRLYPPAYAIGRQAIEDVHLGGYRVEAGTIVLVSPFLLHRKAEYFPEPKTFRPERFGAEAERRLPRGAYIPFSLGPRNCIGSLFALMEAQIVLSLLAPRVRFELVQREPVPLQPMITLRPAGGIRMRVRRLA